LPAIHRDSQLCPTDKRTRAALESDSLIRFPLEAKDESRHSPGAKSMRNIVNALLVRDRKILLAQRSLQRKAYPGSWSFPGGHVEHEETVEEALVREVREELGVSPTAFASLGTINDPNAPSDDPVTYHMYLVPSWEGGEPKMIGDEHTELRWLSAERASTLEGLALEEYRPLCLRVVSHTC
jgi:mutator protein MutT